jgi:hypothetical protein
VLELPFGSAQQERGAPTAAIEAGNSQVGSVVAHADAAVLSGGTVLTMLTLLY